jgi:ATP-dependent DNA ligase
MPASAGGAPNFYGLPAAMWRDRQHELVVFAFDMVHRDGRDLRTLPLIERRRSPRPYATRPKIAICGGVGSGKWFSAFPKRR